MSVWMASTNISLYFFTVRNIQTIFYTVQKQNGNFNFCKRQRGIEKIRKLYAFSTSKQ